MNISGTALLLTTRTITKKMSMPSLFLQPQKIQLAHNAIIDDNLKQDISIEKCVKRLIELF